LVFGDDGEPWDQWNWRRLNNPVDLTAGSHTLILQVREGGFAVDKILFTSNSEESPTGIGPYETP